MFVIQNGRVVVLPDDAPVPPGSLAVEVPDDFAAQPYRYVVEGDRLVPRPEEEVAALERPTEIVKLTDEEIRIVKQAIAEGRLGTTSTREDEGGSDEKAS